MKLYEKDGGWANMPEIIRQPEPFILCLGGRGTGKTYGTIKYLLENEIPFIYLRRTSSQMELVAKNDFSPIVKVGEDLGLFLTGASLSKYVHGVFHVGEDGKPAGEAVAYLMALSTMSNARSFSADRVKIIVYDEAIPERHERELSHEEDAILNMYESVNRNRELSGEDPVKLLVLANANDLEAPVLRALRAVHALDAMRKSGAVEKHLKTQGLCVVVLKDSPVSANKRATALYRLAGSGNDFSDMAIENSFSKDNYADLRPRPLQEFIPLAGIGEITLYRHKSDGTYYVSEKRSGDPEIFENTTTDRVRFRKKYFPAWEAYFKKRLYFETAPAKVFYRAVMNENM